MSKYDDLVKKLKEIFQIDRPELDFGVYRILNVRAGEINDYLGKRLKAKVKESLTDYGSANMEGLLKELIEKEEQYRADGLNTDTVPRVIELRKKIAANNVSSSEIENALFTHLLTFFSRYYDKGDFISQRRYKGDTYAIPYAGEEVMLHWANKDQYYTKSSEYFSNYAFKLDNGRIVRFRLVTADTAKDNRKDNDKERRFVLIEKHSRTHSNNEGEEYDEELQPVEEVNGELVLRFEYKPMTIGNKQEELVAEAVRTILEDPIVKSRWFDLSNREPTEKNPHRTLLEKCLTNYTTKNTGDYFIHKDLSGFLRHELDFYIKNEVLHLEDLQHAEKFCDVEKNLRMIQTLRAIALDLIAFLAQLEDFQKKLWLKRKFVVDSHYCITLDRLPESLYFVIASNPKQWEQWSKLGVLEIKETDLLIQANEGSIKYLQTHQYLMVDTSLYDASFKHVLLATLDNLDDKLDGLMVQGDNFQALNLLQARYREQVKCIYIDPPYNTAASEILYKNEYKHSSWCSLMHDRIRASTKFLNKEGLMQIAIDDTEFHRLEGVVRLIFGDENYMGNIAIMHNPKGRDKKHIADCHEYTILAAKDIKNVKTNRLKLTNDELLNKYSKGNENNRHRELPLRRSGSGAQREDRPYMYYPFLCKKDNLSISLLPRNEYDCIYDGTKFNDTYVDSLTQKYELQGYFVILPIRDDGSKGRWRWGYDSAEVGCQNGTLFAKIGKSPTIYQIDEANDTYLPKSLWYGERFDASTKGTNLLKDLLPGNPFDYPKSIHTIEDMISIGCNNTDTVLDFFAGSGTTGHASISLNRQDNGRRKYILVEQGEYFDTVLKPRIQKVVYSANWKDGKATAHKTGISHAFKILKLESYEDTLNNLQLRRAPQLQSLLQKIPRSAQEDYLLRYMLDIESRGSLLSVDLFNKPFDCKLKVAVDSAGAYEERSIDLVETFNYLIGLRAKHIDIQQDKGFVLITGWLPDGKKTLVIWRDVKQVDYEKLNRLCEKLAINPADSEFDVIYINGDHNIPTIFESTEAEGGITKTLKIRQIEPEFLNRMFAVEGI